MRGLWQSRSYGYTRTGDKRKKVSRYFFIKDKRSKYSRMDKDFNKEYIEGKPPHPMIYNIWFSCFDSKRGYKEGYIKEIRRHLRGKKKEKLYHIKKDINKSYDITFDFENKTYPWA